MASNFDRAFAFVVGEEGGYVNDPHDPGGETKYGISKRAYPSRDIKNLTLEEAKEIYYRDYWLAAIPGARKDWTYGQELCAFDCAVNQGVHFATSNYAAVDRQASKSEWIVQYQAGRALRYAGTKNFDRYGKGWLRRLIRVSIEASNERT